MRLTILLLALILPSVLQAQASEETTYERVSITSIVTTQTEPFVEQQVTAVFANTNQELAFTFSPSVVQPELVIGQQYVVQQFQQAPGETITIVREPWRLPALLTAFLIFIGVALLSSGKRGLGSIVGLLSSIVVLAFIVLPLIIYGFSAILACIIGCILIATLSIFAAHGVNKRSKIAFVSIITTIVLTMVFGTLGVYTAALYGLGSEEARFIITGGLEYINLRGVLLGGMLLGALGVLDDITTAQTAAIDELSRANANLGFKELWQAGRSIGNEHIASLINTLALAYFGASLPLLLLLFTDPNSPWWVTLNTEFLAEEIMRTITGSIALVLAVPITTYIAAKQFANGNCSNVRGGHVCVH